MNENTKMTPLKEVNEKELYVIYCPFCDQKIVFKIDPEADFIGTKKNRPRKIVK